MTEQTSLDLGGRPPRSERLNGLWTHTSACGWWVSVTVDDDRRALMWIAADHGFGILGAGAPGVQRERNVAGFSVQVGNGRDEGAADG